MIDTLITIAQDLASQGEYREAHVTMTRARDRVSEMLKALEAEAIEVEAAWREIDHWRETAPRKAAFLELFGQDAWDATKTVTPVRKLRWQD